MSSEELKQNVKEWIKIDNAMEKLKTELNELNEKKKKISELLLTFMKKDAIECFDIPGGSLIFKKNKNKKQLNKKSLKTILEKYFHGQNRMDIKEMTNFILSSREIKITEQIVRK